MIPKLEILWNSREAILDILEDELSILAYLDDIDLKLEETSFHFRFKIKSIKQEIIKKTK